MTRQSNVEPDNERWQEKWKSRLIRSRYTWDGKQSIGLNNSKNKYRLMHSFVFVEQTIWQKFCCWTIKWSCLKPGPDALSKILEYITKSPPLDMPRQKERITRRNDLGQLQPLGCWMQIKGLCHVGKCIYKTADWLADFQNIHIARRHAIQYIHQRLIYNRTGGHWRSCVEFE